LALGGEGSLPRVLGGYAGPYEAAPLKCLRRCFMEFRILSSLERTALQPEAASLFYALLHMGFPREVMERALLESVILFRATGLSLDGDRFSDILDRGMEQLSPFMGVDEASDDLMGFGRVC